MRRGRKNLLPLALLTLICWGLLGGIIAVVDPVIIKDFPIKNSYLIFLGIWFLAWFGLISLITRNGRRGLIYSFGLTGLLVLRLMRLGNVVNAILLTGLTIAVDFYLNSR